ncbi:myocardin-related transcription factor [Rhynchophorus ferrugineus]|uniref:myocardin-related transcription factor n=1 Tax=Rhynchophorus ferrugineus TaxID=354439 RepID=UPI003FCE03D9
MPPHGQRRSAERAKTGDILKAKIQQRPPRQELERRHILEADALHADPSLAERQRMLKKARLADQLNDQLSHRPGPLELIQKNILHTEEPIEQAVKTGKIPYKATSEGSLKRPQLPQNYVNPEEDSQGSSEGDTVSPGPSDVLETAAKSAGIVVSLYQHAEGPVVLTSTAPVLNKDSGEQFVFTDLCRQVPGPLLSQASASSPGSTSLVSSTSTLSPLSSVASPVPSIASQPATPAPMCKLSHVKTDAPGKDKNRKKCKSKTAPKARTIKFHEYKGPPSAQKNNSSSCTTGESSYDLLLKQQTLLLHCQLQLQHKYRQIILPAHKSPGDSSPSSSSTSNNCNGNINIQQHSPVTSTTSEPSAVGRITGRLEDMKVSDLKAELKRRSLPVSGSKPQLIERLKSYTNQMNNDVSHNGQGSVDSSVHSERSQDVGSPHDSLKNESQDLMEIADPLSPGVQADQKSPDMSQAISEDLVREQQRKIKELERQLSAMSQKQVFGSPRAELQKHIQAKQQQQQQLNQLQQQQQQQSAHQQQNIAMPVRQLQALQAKQTQVNEEQQRLQQQQHVAFQNQKNLAGLLMNDNDIKGIEFVLNSTDAALVCQLMHGKATKGVNGHNRTHSLPNVLTSIVKPQLKKEFIEDTNKHFPDQPPKKEFIEDFKQFGDVKIKFLGENGDSKPPPLYEEATRQMGKKNSVKSQVVDDVLDILIKNGELPASAASYPSTPGSAGTKNQEPVYPIAGQQPADGQGNVQMFENIPDTGVLNDIDPSELLDNYIVPDINQFFMDLGENGQQENNNVQNQNGAEPMDTEEWLDSLIANDNYVGTNGSGGGMTSLQPENPALGDYDPLLGVHDETFDPFNLEEFRSPADMMLPWDRIDTV